MPRFPRFTSHFRWETELDEREHQQLADLLRRAFARTPGAFADRSWERARKEARLWLATEDDLPVAHLAVERRVVGVAGLDVLLAGVGDVAVDPAHQGAGLGRALVGALRAALATVLRADYALLQCGEDVADFYLRSGWTRVPNAVRQLNLGDQRTPELNHEPTMVMAGTRDLDAWPVGVVDLRGLPW